MKEHKGVPYDPKLLSDLSYRERLYESICSSNKLKIKKKDGLYLLVDFLEVVGTYKNRASVLSTVSKWKKWPEIMSMTTKVAYGKCGFEYYISESQFIKHIAKHVMCQLTADMAKIFTDSSVVKTPVVTTPNSSELFVHRDVQYEPVRLVSETYRIIKFEEISVKNNISIKRLDDTDEYKIVDMMFIAGEYEDKDTPRKLITNRINNPDEKLVVTQRKYNNGLEYFCTYTFFFENILSHIRGRFADHIRRSMSTNDHLMSTGSKAVEAVVEHNRAMNESAPVHIQEAVKRIDKKVSEAVSPIVDYQAKSLMFQNDIAKKITGANPGDIVNVNGQILSIAYSCLPVPIQDIHDDSTINQVKEILGDTSFDIRDLASGFTGKNGISRRGVTRAENDYKNHIAVSFIEVEDEYLKPLEDQFKAMLRAKECQVRAEYYDLMKLWQFEYPSLLFKEYMHILASNLLIDTAIAYKTMSKKTTDEVVQRVYVKQNGYWYRQTSNDDLKARINEGQYTLLPPPSYETSVKQSDLEIQLAIEQEKTKQIEEIQATKRKEMDVYVKFVNLAKDNQREQLIDLFIQRQKSELNQ